MGHLRRRDEERNTWLIGLVDTHELCIADLLAGLSEWFFYVLFLQTLKFLPFKPFILNTRFLF